MTFSFFFRTFGACILLLCLAACSTFLPTSQSFRGYFTSASETSSFVPCNMVQSGTPGVGYWLSATSESKFFEQLQKTVESSNSGGGAIPTPKVVYVRFEGDLSVPGQYGHLGQYPREITVKRVLEMTPSTGAECRS